MWLLISTIFIHLTFLSCIFDVYFEPTRPEINQVHVSPLDAPAKRLVMFVVDGLSANSVFGIEDEDIDYPVKRDSGFEYIGFVAGSDGVWGVSESKVPKITRPDPGLLAMFSGQNRHESFNVFSQKNDIIDTVLNHSRNSWCWSSVDILAALWKGANQRVHVYPNEKLQNIYLNNSTSMDKWVFNEVTNFFIEAKKQTHINEDKAIFYIGLPGTSIGTHVDGRKRPELNITLRVIDEGISNTVKIIENFFNNDNKTTYLFTANHGGISRKAFRSRFHASIETPFLMWGAGINKAAHIKGFSDRCDIQQIDIAVMISTVLGIPIPKNSLGTFHAEYFNMTKFEISLALLTNAKQLGALFLAKDDEMKPRYAYQPYADLTQTQLHDRIRRINDLVIHEFYDLAIEETKKLINETVSGCEYYDTYYEEFLLIAMNISITLWVLVLFEMILRRTWTEFDVSGKQMLFFSDKHCQTLIIVMYGLTYLSASYTCYVVYESFLPYMFYAYCCLPQILFCALVSYAESWGTACKIIATVPNYVKIQIIVQILVFWTALNLMALTFLKGFLLTFGLLVSGIWPVISNETPLPKRIVLKWMSSTLILSFFPLLNVLDVNLNYNCLLPISGILWVLIAFVLAFKQLPSILDNDNNSVIAFQPWFLLLIVGFASIVRYRYVPSEYVFPMQCAAWILLVGTLMVPLLGSMRVSRRLEHIALAVAGPYMLLSISFEPIFLIAFIFHMYTWVEVECALLPTKIEKPLTESTSTFAPMYISDSQMLDNHTFDMTVETRNNVRNVEKADFRRALYCFFFMMVAIFGSGRFESGHLYDKSLVDCFAQVHAISVRTVLFVCKALMPFTMTGAAYRAINLITNASFRKCLYILIMYSAVVALYIVYYVQNNADSVLDTEMAVANFMVVQIMVFFIMTVYGITIVYTSVSIPNIRAGYKYFRAAFENS